MERDTTRRSLLAGAGAGAVALLAACGGDAKPRPAEAERGGRTRAPADLEILAYALTLEYFESAYYNRLVDADILSGKDLDLAKVLRDNEAEHVDALEAALEPLGGTAPKRPQPDFEKLFSGGTQAVLERTADIENLGAAAYLGQAARLQDEDLLSAALSIHAIEARHAAVLNRRVGRPFTPDGALAVPMDMDDVLTQVQEFLL